MIRLLIPLACLPFAACTWVALDAPAGDVLVLPPERLTAECRSLGRVKVSVLDKVGVLERHDDEVVEDLHVLARNHGAKVNGDTVVPRGPVIDGIREYEIYRCMEGTGPSGETPAKPRESDSKVEVLPYEGGDN